MLYIVATPIGNILDMSPHAKEVLASVDFILCEDTRRTSKLLHMLEIFSPTVPFPQLISCHAHNEYFRVERALDEIIQGKKAALVSDAGTPAVSDPGMLVVAQAHKRGIAVVPVVGASAVSGAVSVAGFTTPPYHFLGFAPRKTQQRKDWIVQWSQLEGVVVIFEAGNRFAELLGDLQSLLPTREMCLCRELTKTYQEIRRDVIANFTCENVLGEVTIVIGPGEPVVVAEEVQQNLKAIAKMLGDEWGISKRDAYNLLISIKPK